MLLVVDGVTGAGSRDSVLDAASGGRACVQSASFLEVSPVLLLHLFGQLRIAARAAPDRPFHEIHFPPEVREAGGARGRVERDDQRDTTASVP